MRAPTALERLAGTLAGRRLAEAVVRRFDATLVDGDRVPRSGGALLVGNHALLGMDSVVLAPLLQLETRRTPRWLAERNIFRVPLATTVLGAVGAIPGEPAGAVELLCEGHLVAVYPGGVDDSFKLASEAYRLMWRDRTGFAKVAMRAGVPIVPIAATGVDELFSVIAREPWVGRTLLGSSRYDLPVVLSPLPRRVPLRYHVLPPVDTTGDPDDPADVLRVRQLVWDALESVLAPYREARG